ncbi:MAG: 6-phosphofructokinase [Marinilabiliales bacterium]|nr:MAG: 6-phosphofructokinase [Marinilabiliales bacterium]
MDTLKRIAVLTSGGDSPGMNAAIRAVVKTALYHDIEVYGIYRGYHGMVNDLISPLKREDVKYILPLGGTILKSARSEEFRTPEGRKKAYENLKKHNIDALVVIGGDGTFTGAKIFMNEFDFPVIGLPGTIDNDLFGTDYTIGYDTAVNTVVSAIDKLRDTAYSHDMVFIVEVMGRDAGFIALRSGLASGSGKILIPETKTCTDELSERLRKRIERDETSAIIVVAEGDDFGGAFEVKKIINERFPDLSTRVTILGHIQRGGSPSAFDRILASGLGYQAVKGLMDGKSGVMVGSVNRKIEFVPFDRSIKHHNKINVELKNIAEILAS